MNKNAKFAKLKLLNLRTYIDLKKTLCPRALWQKSKAQKKTAQ
jgi:hypothetical protein